MDKSNVIKKKRVTVIRKLKKRACNGNTANVTSVMAVDSHDDNHYNELTVGNANNNNNSAKKNLHQTSIKLESREDDFGLDLVEDDDSSASLYLSYSTDPSQICQGSARRKHSSVSKGITIEEFLLKEERCGQLSVIDKLILKNKVALRSVQMKQTRSKLTPAQAGPAATNGKDKKEAKPKKERVLGSKIAAARKRTAAAATAASEATKKTKNVTTVKVEGTTKTKAKDKRALPVIMKVSKKKEAAPATVPQKIKKEGKKETAAATATATDDKKRKIGVGVKIITKMKKKVNKSDKLTDLRNIKPNVSHKTRSFNKVVQLRNGKSRIVQDKKTSPLSLQPRKYNRRSVADTSLNGSTKETPVNGIKPSPAPAKRSIKQEPLDDDAGIKRKRRRTTTKLNTSGTPANAPAVAPDTPATVHSAQATVPDLAAIAPGTPAVAPGTPAAVPNAPVVAADNAISIPKLSPESTPIPAQIPILQKEIPPPISKPKPTLEEAPIIAPTVEKSPPIPAKKPSIEKAPFLEPDIVSSSQSDISLIIEDSPEPPILSPALPTILGETIVIDSTGESDTESEESPPVITAQTPTPVNAAKSAKLDVLEDTATETSEDTGDEEFALQDANTESEDVIDEDISLQYVTDDEDSTDKDIANEPTVAAVATAADPVKEPKEPVESAREKIAPIVEEPKVVPSQEKPPKQPITQVQDRPENKAVKESILGALGLQSLEKVQQRVKENNNYTGTLKAVIKVDKGCRRMELKPKDSGASIEGFQNENVLSFYSKIMPSKFDHVSDSGSGIHDRVNSTEGHVNGVNHDEGLLSSLREANNCKNMETDYNVIDPVSGLLAKEKTKAAASLVVPEKSSSFSIHPNRLCSDVCKYCFGKFGSLDTPCHVGQMKNPERQRKILLCEPNLKLDTCLCDACYRFVDRKANKPPSAKRNKNNMRRSISINQRNLGPCVVQNCSQFARHTAKRKWLLRISKKVAKLSFDVNKRGPRMQYGLCTQHYCMVDYYTCCGVCKKRLNRNHMYSIRSELNEMNTILEKDRIPVTLQDNMLLCKLCHYYISLRRKYGSSAKMSPSNRQYYNNFLQKVRTYYSVPFSDSEDPITSECLKYESAASMVEVGPQSPEIPSLSSKMIEELSASSPKTKTSTITTSIPSNGDSKRTSSGSSSSSKKNNHNVGFREIADLLKPLEGDGDKNSTRIQVKFGNLNIGKLSNLNIGQNSSTHQSEAKHEKSGDKELPIIADFCFETPAPGQKNLEKCVSTIQFDKGTKKLWQDLQKPYGNQSSFIRHLITLEKHWRSGAMILAPNADPGAVKYINSVKNRIQSFEMSSSSATASPAPTPPPSASATSSSKPMPTVEQYMNNLKSRMQTMEVCSSSTPSPCRTPTSTQTSHAPTPAVSAPKTISLPTLKPATSSASETTSSTESSSSSVHVRHTPDPPPLLKIDQMNGQFGASRKVPVSTESKTRTSHKVTPRNRDRSISLEQYVGMMHPQPRTKHSTVVTNGSVGYRVPISIAKKTMPTMKPIHIANSSSVESIVASSSSQISKKSASVVYQGTANSAKPRDKPYYTMSMPAMPQLTAISTIPKKNAEPSSVIIAKLPKTLTVTQIDDPMPNHKMTVGDRAPSITAPFLAGEKPSVTVFREVTK